jgi:phenylacetate-CoA ligase
MMKGENNLWNPVLETMPLEDLKKLQLKKFQRVFSYVYDNSPFYRKKYDKAGIKPADIKTLDDIRKVPFSSKEELRGAQENKEPFPFGELLAVPMDQVTEYHQTTGTTGMPVRYADTWEDWEWFSEKWAYTMYSRGFRETDIAYLPFPYHLFLAFWGAHYGVEKIGAMVIAGGQASTEERVREIADLRCTTILCTPTYALNLAATARKLGFDPVKLAVNKIFCAGEPGASIPATKKRIEDAWGAKVYDVAGATEAPMWAFECIEQIGNHINEAMDYVEILNPETYEPVGPGEIGTVVLTSFDRLAMPSVRYDLKDLVKLAPESQKCPCGRTWRMYLGGILGRRDDISKVRGVLFAPGGVEEAVRRIPELSDEFELVVYYDDKGYEQILVKVESLPQHENIRDSLKDKLERELRTITQLRCDVEFHPCGSLPRYEVKAKRFKDLRKGH